jgi:hypothetical protein
MFGFVINRAEDSTVESPLSFVFFLEVLLDTT